MVCCKSCFSLKIPGTWIEFSDLESSVSHFIEESISWNQDATKIKSNLELKQLDPQKFRAQISCEGDYQGVDLVSELKTEVQIKFQVCQTCSRQPRCREHQPGEPTTRAHAFEAWGHQQRTQRESRRQPEQRQ